jgi:hypothetical protein
MNARNRVGALLAAASLLMALVAVTYAAPPTYGVSLTKSANPTTVPPAGGSVTYTIVVTGTGTGDLLTVSVDDGMAGCTLSGPTGDQSSGAGAGKLEQGESWTYTCTVNGVAPGTQNTATVFACKNASACNQSAHDVNDSDSVTVGQGEGGGPTPTPTIAPPTATPTVAPPTATPTVAAPTATATEGAGTPTATVDPSSDEEAVDATVPNTDTLAGSGNARPGANTWLLVVSLGLLLASIVVVSPPRPARARDANR